MKINLYSLVGFKNCYLFSMMLQASAGYTKAKRTKAEGNCHRLLLWDSSFYAIGISSQISYHSSLMDPEECGELMSIEFLFITFHKIVRHRCC